MRSCFWTTPYKGVVFPQFGGQSVKRSQVVVELHISAAQATLRIHDDGRGFDPGTIPPGHLGVGIMREQAESVGIALKIDNRAGYGTEIIAEWQAREGRGNIARGHSSMDGVKTTRMLCKRHPETQVIALIRFQDGALAQFPDTAALTT